MPRVSIFQGGNVQSQGTTDARFRAVDWGPSAMGEGLQALGKAGAEVADKLDDIEDVKARVEANRLAVEHSEHVREISQRVKETLGEGAEGAADQGVADLQKVTKDIIGRASPRAQMLLQNELTVRSGAAIDGWHEHGFRQKGEALETSSVARIERIVEDAADTDDEDAAVQMLGQVRGINEKRAQFFGKGKEWLIGEDRKVVSSFYKSRSMKLAAGDAGSASAAIAYAEKHRDMLTDGDYMDIVNGYDNAATDETAAAMIHGANPVGAAVEAGPAPPDGSAPKAVLDPVAFFKGFISPHEGSKLVVDSNGAAVKYGVNQAYHPGESVAHMTEDRAAQIFKTDYFIPSGADKLPPALAAIHADTYWLNKSQAMKILKASGGDPDKYIEMRQAFLDSLIAKNPAKYAQYKPGWDNRTKQLADYSARLGGDGTPIGALPVGPTTSLESFRTQVMARTDIGMGLKTEIIRVAEQRRAEVRQEQQISEERTDKVLLDSAVALGDNFTDVKQLPQAVWLSAPSSLKEKYQNMAKANVEKKPLKPDVAAQIGFLRTFKPQSLADPKVLSDLAHKGVPPSMINTLAMEGGRAQGAIAGLKPEAVTRGTMESIARPAFEAAGYVPATTESSDGDKSKKMAERQLEAKQQMQLMGFLDEAASAWASANPGKQPDEKTIKGWVGMALVKNTTGNVLGLMDDEQLYKALGHDKQQEIQRMLIAGGIRPTAASVARYYRMLKIYRGR